MAGTEMICQLVHFLLGQEDFPQGELRPAAEWFFFGALEAG